MKFIKRLLKVTVLLYLTAFFSSCTKDWFDEKSDKNLSVPATLQDFEYLLDNYEVMVLTSPAMGEIASEGHYMPEALWQSLPPNDVTVGAWKNAYTWSNDFLYNEVKDWNWNYRKIFQCNLVLEGLEKIVPTNSTDLERLNSTKGNALFHRAKSFYDLAQIYAPPYKLGSADVDLGIPIKDGNDVTEVIKRSSVKQTYERIITDLLEAANLLPLKGLYLTRASKLACYGLLARIYLLMGNYERSGFYASEILKQQSNLILFHTIPATNTTMGLFNEEVFFHSLLINESPVFSAGYVFISQYLYDLYDVNDLRKSRFFTPTSNGILFKGMYNNSTLQFAGLAVDEIYLIRAESYTRLGNVQAGMKDLNDLLRSRWAINPNGTSKYQDKVAASEIDALRIILLERKKELLLRGLHWTDLRRLNMDERFKTTVTRIIGGKTYVLEPNSHKYTFPIPDDERSFSNIQQNVGWDR